MMKELNSFFNMAAFCKGKQFSVKEVRDHYSYVNGEKQDTADGVTIVIIITDDSTDYCDADVSDLNLYELFNVKCLGVGLKEAEKKFPVKSNVRFKRYKKATVYGKYQDNLSVEINSLDDMEVVANE